MYAESETISVESVIINVTLVYEMSGMHVRYVWG
jgi:hypothetical protein